MSFLKRRGDNWVLYDKIRVPHPAFNPGIPEGPGNERMTWKQITRVIGPDAREAKEYRTDYDYDRKRHRLGLPNDRAKWIDFKDQFLAGYRGKTLSAYRYIFERFEKLVKPEFVGTIDYPQAKAWRRGLETLVSPAGRPYSATTINWDIRGMRTAWNEALKMKYATSNPFRDVAFIPTTKREIHSLTIPHVQALLAEAKKSSSPDAYPLTVMFIYSGLRLGEVLHLRWEDVDLDRQVIHLRLKDGATLKDKEERTIGMHQNILSMLKKRVRRGDYIFPGQDTDTREDKAVSRLFSRMMKRAGIPFSGVHVLRHTFATHSGLAPKVLRDILGHSDIKTTMIYDHVTQDQLDGIKRVSYG